MADRTWQIEHGVNFGSLSGVLQVSLEVTSVTTYHTRHLYDGVLLVLYVAALVALGLRPRGLCTVATRACHVNHAPPSYNYNIHTVITYTKAMSTHKHAHTHKMPHCTYMYPLMHWRAGMSQSIFWYNILCFSILYGRKCCTFRTLVKFHCFCELRPLQ